MNRAREAFRPERVCKLMHVAGGTEERRCWLSATVVWVDWGTAGMFRVQMSGKEVRRVIGGKGWFLSPDDFEWFKDHIRKAIKQKRSSVELRAKVEHVEPGDRGAVYPYPLRSDDSTE